MPKQEPTPDDLHTAERVNPRDVHDLPSDTEHLVAAIRSLTYQVQASSKLIEDSIQRASNRIEAVGANLAALRMLLFFAFFVACVYLFTK